MQLRYNFSASYLAPKVGGFGFGDWFTDEAEFRSVVAATLRRLDVDVASLYVVLQHKKSRWLTLRSGPVAEIFPDLWSEYLASKEVAAILSDASLSTATRSEASYYFRKGLAESIATLEERKNELEQTLEVLHRIQKHTANTIELPRAEI